MRVRTFEPFSAECLDRPPIVFQEVFLGFSRHISTVLEHLHVRRPKTAVSSVSTIERVPPLGAQGPVQKNSVFACAEWTKKKAIIKSRIPGTMLTVHTGGDITNSHDVALARQVRATFTTNGESRAVSDFVSTISAFLRLQDNLSKSIGGNATLPEIQQKE